MNNDLDLLKEHNIALENELSILRQLSDNFMDKLYGIMNNSYETLILFFDTDFNLEHYNIGLKKLLGYDEDGFYTDLHTANMAVFAEAKNDYLKSKKKKKTKNYTKEIVAKNVNGRKVYILFYISEIISPDDEKKGFLFLGYNITLRKKMELKLEKRNRELVEKNRKIEEANRYKTEFLNNITHELRTPLSGIIGIVKLTSLLHIENADLEKNLNMISSNSKNLLDIINQLLDISRIEAGRMGVSLSKIPLGLIIYNAESLAKSLLLHKDKVKFVYECDDPEKTIYTDHSKIRQILTNLIGNSVKFTEEGEIFLKTKVNKKNQLILVVRDSGIGIKKDDLDKIFKPFVQADGTITRKYGGTGLGLTITKKMVELLNGTLQVNSKYGQGTEFILTFNLDKIP